MRDKKEITWRQLKVGQPIDEWKTDNCTHIANAIVKQANSAFVVLNLFNKYDEKVDSATTKFFVPLTDEEYKQKYFAKAKEIAKSLTINLAHDEIGYHEMWNGWVSYDPYELAEYCTKESLTIVGYSSNVYPHENWEIGICAEYSDGQRFWCHYHRMYIDNMKQDFPELFED